MSRERQLVHRSQIVHVEESRAVVLVEASDEEIDLVRSARAEEIGQILSGKMSRRFRRKIVTVAIFVKLDVLTDVLGELRGGLNGFNGRLAVVEIYLLHKPRLLQRTSNCLD